MSERLNILKIHFLDFWELLLEKEGREFQEAFEKYRTEIIVRHG